MICTLDCADTLIEHDQFKQTLSLRELKAAMVKGAWRTMEDRAMNDFYYIFAGSANTPARVLEKLATHPACKVRRQLGGNPRTPRHLLVRLSYDWDYEVRASVGTNPASPLEVVEELAGDANADVRYAVAECRYTPFGLLQTLAADENPYVADCAQRTIKLLTKKGF